jgi:hypothetical protein
MAHFTSAVERTFVTCSAPNITGGKIQRVTSLAVFTLKAEAVYIIE